MRKWLPWDLLAQKTAKFPPSITLLPIHYKQRQFQFLALMVETEHFKTFAQGGRPRPRPPYAKNLAHRSRQLNLTAACISKRNSMLGWKTPMGGSSRSS